jgi:hypothetical protein
MRTPPEGGAQRKEQVGAHILPLHAHRYHYHGDALNDAYVDLQDASLDDEGNLV